MLPGVAVLRPYKDWRNSRPQRMADIVPRKFGNKFADKTPTLRKNRAGEAGVQCGQFRRSGMNRRKMLSLLGVSPALLAGATLDAQETKPKAAQKTTAATGAHRVEGLNPKGTPPPVQLFPMAPRLDSLDGKTVWLIDTGFEGGGFLLQQIQLWFQQNMPTVNAVFRRKAGPYMEDDPALWQEIKAKGHAAIMAIGH